MSRSIPPSVVPPSPNEWPVTYRVVTGITRGTQAVIQSPNHGFTNASDVGITQLDFSQVKGMQEINGKFGYITNVINSNFFQIGIDTSFFKPYTSGGFCNINAGNSPYDPFQNIA